jgi:undecaprenyl diphosphate synthase
MPVPTSPLDRIRLKGEIPSHVAIIMDGNGRWAGERGLPRHFGHQEGMKAVRRVIEGAIEVNVETLTLFAFSTDNWQRPPQEVSALMSLLQVYARREVPNLRERGVRVHVLGDLERIDTTTRAAVDTLVQGTVGGSTLRLNLMISYGGREELIRAARLLAERVQRGEVTPDEIDDEALEEVLFTKGIPSPDLLIRTSGEFRISNFMLWQLAYTELHISPVFWPDFDRDTFYEAIIDYQSRDRGFGRVAST